VCGIQWRRKLPTMLNNNAFFITLPRTIEELDLWQQSLRL
jgi:hypothetical protein